MTLSSRIALVTATVAVAAGAAAPALASSMTHWSQPKCAAYAHKYAKTRGKTAIAANKVLGDHGCKQKVR